MGTKRFQKNFLSEFHVDSVAWIPKREWRLFLIIQKQGGFCKKQRKKTARLKMVSVGSTPELASVETNNHNVRTTKQCREPATQRTLLKSWGRGDDQTASRWIHSSFQADA
jgi:hypothetical protein